MKQMELAIAEGERRMNQVAENAGLEWQEAALAWLRHHLCTHPVLLPDAAKDGGCPVPVSGWRAMGAVVRRALAEGWIERDGWARRASGHGTPAAKYRSLLYGEAS